MGGRLTGVPTQNQQNNAKVIFSIILTVGAVPDMLYFTHDCQRILVAIEGELKTLPDGSVVDPEGGVVIITNLDTSPSVKMLNFTQFNAE